MSHKFYPEAGKYSNLLVLAWRLAGWDCFQPYYTVIPAFPMPSANWPLTSN